MKEKFFEYFEGYFNNQKQAFKYPAKFALIELNHKKLNNDKFLIEQKYVHEKDPYRKTIIEVVENNNYLLIKNYKDDNTYLNGCDVIFEYINEEFHGKNICNECYVTYQGKNTYLLTESILGNGYYKVIDTGYDVESNLQIWGSFHGMFQFDRK
jgi:CpeT protein